jgi:hypothetical protein
MPTTRARSLRILGLLGALALAAACTGPRAWWHKDLQEWQGAPVQEVLDAWGPPLRALTGEAQQTVLVYDRVRELDHRLEHLRDPGARLRPEQGETVPVPHVRTDCLVYFDIESDHVAKARHEGSACDIVPRDPARRRADPTPRRGR